MVLVGGCRVGEFLDDFETDHFTGDLGKALDPAHDTDEPVGIDFHHIAGVVPAVAKVGNGGLQDAGLVGFQVAAHHVGATHVQDAAGVDAGNRLQLQLDAGQQRADGAGTVGHRGIDRQHRGGFGGAVAFENAQAELFEPQAAHVVGKFLRPGNDIAQAVEIIGMGEFSVVGEEGRCAKEHGAAAVVGEFRNHPVMQRRGVKEEAGAGQDGQQGAGGETERMEDGQGVEHLVVYREIDHRTNLRDVGENGTMRQHDPLGLAFRAGGEQHHRRFVRCGRQGEAAREMQRPQQQP